MRANPNLRFSDLIPTMEDPQDPENEATSAFTELTAILLYYLAASKVYIIIAFVVLLGYGGVQLLKTSKDALEKAATGEYLVQSNTWDPDEAAGLLKQAKKHWAKALEHFDSLDYLKAIELCNVDRKPLVDYLKRYPNEQLKSGITFQQAYEQAFTPVQVAILEHIHKELKEIAQGRDNFELFLHLQHSTQALLTPQDNERIRQGIQDADRQRAHLAPKWIRVQITNDLNSYSTIIKEHLTQAWNPDLGFRLVFSPPFGPTEEQATWKTLLVMGKEEREQYQWTSTGSRDLKSKLIEPPILPVGLSISIKSNPGSGYRSNWDQLSLIDFHNPSPDTLQVGRNLFTAGAEIREIEQKCRELLIEQLNHQLKIPRFDLFPNQPTEAEDVFAGNPTLDRENLRRFALYHRAAFLEKSIEWLAQETIPNRYQILMVWVELNCDEMSDHFIHYLPKVEKRGYEAVWGALKKKPWWGNYQAAISMTDPDFHPVCIDVAQALAQYMDHPDVKRHLTSLMRDHDYRYGYHLAKSYVANTKPENYPELYQIFCNTAPSTATGIYPYVYEHQHDLAVQWLLDAPSSIPNLTLRNMIAANILNDSEPRRQELLDFYLHLFNSKTSDQVRSVIMEELRPYVGDPENWRTAAALDLDLVAPEAAKVFRRNLLNNSHKQPFDQKTDFRLSLIEKYAEEDYQTYLQTLKEHPGTSSPFTLGITVSASSKLMGDDPLKGQHLKRLSDFVLSRPHDYNLQNYLIRDWHSQQWDWSSKEVMDMMKLASAHPREYSRGDVIRQMTQLDPDTLKFYAPIIRARLQKETSPDLLNRLEMLRKKLSL